ncbi:MAG: insulinase family protein, partial [Candidatus Pacebacteria bacterium]|nr:insulinase family protein [Candidatus Paceibacterota bacterium]
MDNGMQVLLIENLGLPMIGVNVVVKTGSAYESFSTSGMSHMLEHLLFNGTQKRSQKELYDEVDLIGGYNNANTSNYYTNYMMVTPFENIKKGMDIQADMLFNSILPEEKFKKEKGIVLEEIARSLGNTDEQMERNLKSVIYPGHALSLPTLGTYSTIESMKRDDVYDYYKNTYVPNNMIMSIVGNFQTDSMLVWIKNIYGKAQPRLVQFTTDSNWSTGFNHLDKNVTLEGKVYHRFYRGEKLFLQLFYELPENWTNAHFVLLDEILSKGSSAIAEQLRDKYTKIEQSLSFDYIQSPIKNLMKVSVTVEKPSEQRELVKSLNQAIKTLNFQLPKESVQFLATKTKTSFLKNVEKPHMFGIYNAEIFATGGIEAVIAAYSTNDYIKSASDLSKFSIAIEPLVIIQNPAEKVSELEKQAHSAPEILIDKNSGATQIAEESQFSNLLAVHFMFKHKAQYESAAGKDAAKLLHDCFGERLNSVENQKISNKFGLTFKVNDNPYIPMDNIYLDPDFSYIRIEGLADDIPGVTEYIKKQLTDFVPTEEEYQKSLAKSKRPMGGMGSGKSNKLFNDTYKSLVYEDEKYIIPQEKLSYEKLINFGKAYFNPSNMIVAVVSPAKPDSIFDLFNWEVVSSSKTLIEKTPYVKKLKMATAPVNKELEGGGERSFIFWGFITAVEDQDKPAMKALGLLLSDHIIFEIREKQGRAYRMRAGIEMV